MTELIRRKIVGDAWETVVDSDGGSTVGVPVLTSIPFAFDTPNLDTGAEVYMPEVGDILLDAWIEVLTAFDGTTPQADIGTNDGLWAAAGFGAIDVSVGDSELINSLFSSGSGAPQNILLSRAGTERYVPAVWTTTETLLVWVTQDGNKSGTAIGGAAGEALLRLLTIRP